MKEAQQRSVRVDKWLWAARFFKTRNLARQAIDGGKIHLNGYRVKPSKGLNAGDQLRIQKGQQTFDITVLDLSTRRGPASVAQQLYAETEESIQRREQQAEQRRLQNAAGAVRRPDKRERRVIRRFKGR